MPSNEQNNSKRSFLKKNRGKVEFGALLLSTGIGAGIGALIGTFVFPGFGTAAGALIGAAFGAAKASLAICMARTIARTSTDATVVSSFGVELSGSVTGALVGGLIGSFVFPVIGTGFGAVIGAAIGAVASLLLLWGIHSIPAVSKYRIKTEKEVFRMELGTTVNSCKNTVSNLEQTKTDPGMNSYNSLFTAANQNSDSEEDVDADLLDGRYHEPLILPMQ